MGEPTLKTYRTSDGLDLYYRHWVAVGRPRARVVFLHGIRSHGGWYERSCQQLADADIEVFFLDRRGSGLNTAYRGDCPGAWRLIDDVADFLRLTRSHSAWLPLFLAGISWGGKLAVALPSRHPGLAQGIILVAPGFKPRITPSLGQRLRILLARLIRPMKRFSIPLNEAHLFTGSSEWQSYINTDRHGLKEATARFLFNSVVLDRITRRSARRMTLPSLLLLAGRDRILDNAQTRRFVASFPSRENRVIDYPDAEHTLEFEQADHPFVRDVLRWIDRQVK